MKTYFVVYLGAMIIALVLTPFIIRLAKRYSFLGAGFAPRNRLAAASSGAPRLGGVVILIAMLAVVLPAATLNNLIGDSFRFVESRVLTLLGAAIGIFFLGLSGDLFGSRSRVKLTGITLAAAAVCYSGTLITSIHLGPWNSIELGWLAWPITLIWIIGVTVGIHLIDGLDGLAAGIAAITCGVIAAVAIAYGQMVTAILALSLLGSLTGFLVHNFHPAKIRMGDCGSILVGFLVATSTVMCVQDKTQTFLSLVVPSLALGVPIINVLFTMVRRGILERRPMFAAEPGHIHHRLMNMGMGQRQVVLLLYAVSALASGVGTVMFLSRRSSILVYILIGLLPLAIFRLAGVWKTHELFHALRRNFRLGRSTQEGKQILSNTQMQIRKARSLTEWWGVICKAADAMGFTRITLDLILRDGSAKSLLWCRPDCDVLLEETVTARLPVRQRRAGVVVHCQIETSARDSAEMAGHRIMLFSRLLEEHSIADLPRALRTQREEPELAAIPAWDGGALGRAFNRRRQIPKSRLTEQARPSAGDSTAIARRVAVVHDFLYVYAGAERVLEQILNVYPEADVFSLFDFLPDHQRGFLQGKKVRTSFLQRMPLARRNHRAYLPLMPLAIEQLDVSKYDLVISSSYLAAKGVLTRADQLHVCYCHTPARFAWDLQQQYLAETGLLTGIKSFLVRSILHYIRNWDTHSSNGVNLFLTNSNYVGRRIKKIYRRDAATVYPPVDVDSYPVLDVKEDFYLTVSRLVPYKRVDLIVDTFNELKHRRLIVIGDGPEAEKLKAKAGANITFLGHQPFEHVKEYMQRARAFIFAAEEDFGIVPVEAQACGTPVIAYAKGGVTESIVDGRTGVFFQQQTVASLVAAVREFEANDVGWNAATIRANAERFSSAHFRARFEKLVEDAWMAHIMGQTPAPESFSPAAQDKSTGALASASLDAPADEALSRTGELK